MINKNKVIKTKGEAQQQAIDWQYWVSKRNLGYSELYHWQVYFRGLAKKFNLISEFKENAII